MTTGSVTGLNMTLTCEGDVLAGCRSVTLNVTTNTVDVGSADDSSWGAYLLGRKDWTIDFDSLYIYNDVAKKVLCAHVFDGSPASVTCIVTMPDSATYTGEGIVSSITLTGPFDDALTFTGSIMGKGALAASAS